MARRIGRLAALGRFALAGALLQACVATPSQSTEPVAPTSTIVPSPSATAEGVAIHWERIPGLAGASISALVQGASGLVAVGDCGDSGAFQCPTVWTSPDGLEWTAHALPHEWPYTAVWHLAAGAKGYVTGGYDYDIGHGAPPEPQTRYRLWTSTDGVAWDRTGAMAVRDFAHRNETEIIPSDLALAPSGAVVVEQLYHTIGPGTGPYVSEDGREWELVGPEAFGREAFFVSRVESTPAGILLAGGTCQGCLEGVWSSTNGSAWTEVGQIELPSTASATSFATDGRRTVVAMHGSCCSALWGSDESGHWGERLDVAGMSYLGVAYTGSRFVAVGETEAGYVSFVSPDGIAWTEVENDGLDAYYGQDAECPVRRLTASNDTLLAGVEGCPWYRGTVEG